MKNLRLTASLLLSCSIWASALSGQVTFQKYYGDGIVPQHADHVVATSDGYVMAGVTNNTNPNYRFFFMKIGLDGQLLWMRHYANPGVQLYFADLIEANDGGFLAAGGTPDGIPAIQLIKTDANGLLQWQKQIHSYSTNRKNGPVKLCRTADGYIVSGSSTRGDTHPTLTRIDNQGNTLWSKRYMNQSFDNPSIYAALVSGDTIFACGVKDSVATYNLFRASTGDTLYSQWFAAPGGAYSKALYHMAQAPDGDLLLSGFIEVPKLPGDASGTNAAYRLWVCRISRSGQLRWSRIYPESTSSYGFWYGGKITALPGDRYLLINRGLSKNLVMFQIDGQGQVLWAYDYGYQNQPELLSSAIPAPDGGLLALGGARLPGSQQEQIVVIKTDASGIVAQCCTKTAPMTTLPYPLQIIPGGMRRQFDFDPAADWSIDATNANIPSGDFCPPQYRTVQVALCPGDSLVLGNTAYTQPGMVQYLAPGAKCDTLFTYLLITATNPERSETVRFCPGDTVFLQGMPYTQPGTFTLAVPQALGLCDTLVTYTLEYSTDTAVGPASLQCPGDLLVPVPFGASSAPVVFSAPVPDSACPCPGLTLEQTAGLPSGSIYPLGDHTVCFRAADKCGRQASCCFHIRVEADEAAPCDVKTNGCIRFELLGISADGHSRRSYHFRLRNDCAQALQYAAFQLPPGMVAEEPIQNYSAPGGDIYSVRNPNFSPLYSIRFKPQGQGIRNGASDVFSFTLPPFSAPDYIRAVVKLEGQPLVEAHLNTFHCPVEQPAQARNTPESAILQTLTVSPNPAAAESAVRLTGWPAAPARIRVYNAQGTLLRTAETDAAQLDLILPGPAGLYIIEATALTRDWRQTARLVLR